MAAWNVDAAFSRGSRTRASGTDQANSGGREGGRTGRSAGLSDYSKRVIWERERERRRVIVEATETWFTVETELPAPVPLVWDYFTKPEYRKVMMGAEEMPVEDRPMGRAAAGTIYYCAHGDARVRHAVLDWSPFKYYTFETEMPLGANSLITIWFRPLDDGRATGVVGACGKPQGNLLARGALGAIRSKVRQEIMDGVEALCKIVLNELESGVALRPRSANLPEERVAAMVNAAVAESLAP